MVSVKASEVLFRIVSVRTNSDDTKDALNDALEEVLMEAREADDCVPTLVDIKVIPGDETFPPRLLLMFV